MKIWIEKVRVGTTMIGMSLPSSMMRAKAKEKWKREGKDGEWGKENERRYGEDKVSNNEVVERDVVAQLSKRGIEG